MTDAGAVDEQSIAAGVTLSRWFGDEAARVYAVIGGDAESPEAREQRELVRIIQAHGGEITARQLMQTSRRYRASAEEAEAALGRLVGGGIAKRRVDDHGGGQGRPVVVFTLVESGNGNGNSPIPEEVAIPLPLPPVVERKIKPVAPEDCLHVDVEETPTFDGFVNRTCGACGKNLGCRPAENIRK